ncbi:tetratricopeptide repeat protein [Leptospira idonii]|uniref:tetratricopeptide repeat protein n=1 Tax=Leptospira idonii TaxID=1193500 RepID=UPI001FEBC261|nr:hypothetical protein [Leptospira idonii]
MKIRTLYLILISLLIALGISAQSALDEISLGKEKQSANDCKKAIIHFQTALQRNSNSIEAKIGYAQCSKILGSITDSKRAFSEVLKRDPKNFDAVIGLTEINIELGEFSEVPKRIDPLLEEYPNHTGLRILESRFLFAQGRKELAIHKLQRLSEKLNHPTDVEKMLGELYLLTGKWKDSEESLSRYTSLSPSDPDGFYLKAQLNLFQNYFHVPKLIDSLKDAEENINNALSLNSKHEASRLLLVKLKMIQANISGNQEKAVLESAFRIIYELAREFPENKHYHSLEASLAEELGRTQFASYHYRRTLGLDDLDEIVRFAAEEYSVKSEKEDSKLRRELGEYRRERYIAEKHSLYFKSAKFHLLRAKDLSPQTPSVRSELLEFYDLSGESIQYVNLLLRLREEDPSHFKLQNKLDFAIQKLKQSLESKEGYLNVELHGIQKKPTSTSPEVFVFDLESRLAFPENYPAGRLLAKAIRYDLSQIQNVRVTNNGELAKIRNSLSETNFHPFTKTIPFSVESLHNLDQDRRNVTKIRYVVHGSYQYVNDNIEIDIRLYDRKLSRDIGQWKTSQKGRDSLSTIISRVTEKIKNILPIEGKILRVKTDEVLISLGKSDGLSVKSVIQFIKNDALVTEGEIIELGKDMSLVKPKQRGWEKELATGDFVTVRPNEDKARKNN